MPDFCTCGAQLPPDARFCHKCGKPQREEPVIVEEAPPVPVPEPVVIAAPVATEPPPINLRNRTAVRTAMLAGAAAFLISIPLGTLGMIGMLAGGVLAVWMYHRATGQELSISSGAKLGWITGIFLFVLLLLSFTATVALQPTYLEDLRQQLAQRSSLPEAELKQVVDMLFTPIGIAAMLLGMFLSATLPPIVGGAVGARLFGRR